MAKYRHLISIIPAISLITCFAACNGKSSLHNLLFGNECPTNDTAVVVRIDSNMSPLIFDSKSYEGQTGFESLVLDRLFVKLIPNRGGRKNIVQSNGKTDIHPILGVTQFLMDHDLTSGYVHPSIVNFFRILRPDDFVLRFHRDSAINDEGWIEYIRKANASEDSLGKSIGFLRQWRLSEVDYHTDEQQKVLINLKESTYAHELFCPQVKQPTTNPFGKKVPEIPIWVTSVYGGMNHLDDYDHLGLANGGAVVIIWQDSLSRKILFKDVYGSLKRILTIAMDIGNKYRTDPTIGIYDAGRMAWKLKAHNGHISFAELDELSAGYPDFVSAGYGYVDQKQYVKTHSRGVKIFKHEYWVIRNELLDDAIKAAKGL